MLINGIITYLFIFFCVCDAYAASSADKTVLIVYLNGIFKRFQQLYSCSKREHCRFYLRAFIRQFYGSI